MKLFLPMALGALLTGNLSAATTTLNWADKSHSASGGEFKLVTSANGTFNSFCIEHNEFVSLGGTYTYSITGGAIAGGYTGATAGTDPISIGTAYLYRKFIDNTLAGYTHAANPAVFDANAFNSQNNLQNAIWWLEGELGVTQNNLTYAYASNPFLIAAKSALAPLGTFADLQANANGAYGVYAMNMYNANGTKAQDQLIVVPDGGMTLAMLGMACASFGLLRRKF